MALLVIAFFSGVLTVLAPCVLPLLPIVLGASAEDGGNKKIPFVIIGSLSISIILFSLLLKVSTVLIGVPPSFWKSFSGGMLVALGLITIFPNIWKNISVKLGFSGKSNQLLHKSQEKKGMIKYVLMGFALGPVFSSCSPTYALILAIILPAGFLFGFLSLIFYALGLAAILLAISLFGQKLIKNLKWVSNPKGIFKKILGMIFVLVGLAIISGFDKKIETALLDAGFINTTNFEQKIIDELELGNTTQKKNQGGKCKRGSCDAQIVGGLPFLHLDNILIYKSGEILAEKGYQAPDFVGLTDWINSQEIISLKDLIGQVVMIEFWNMDCVNCIQTHPDTNKLYNDFSNEGLVVIGVHAPEFANQQKRDLVEQASKKHDLLFPIALDNDYETMKAYSNSSWPATYLIDAEGYMRYTHMGIGGYEDKREAIIELLGETI